VPLIAQGSVRAGFRRFHAGDRGHSLPSPGSPASLSLLPGKTGAFQTPQETRGRPLDAPDRRRAIRKLAVCRTNADAGQEPGKQGEEGGKLCPHSGGYSTTPRYSTLRR